MLAKSATLKGQTPASIRTILKRLLVQNSSVESGSSLVAGCPVFLTPLAASPGRTSLRGHLHYFISALLRNPLEYMKCLLELFRDGKTTEGP